MRFTFRQLEYFVAAGETGSITLASERINISPPSISTAISHLEEELGVQLFIRHHALGLSLTRAGRSLLREAKSVLAQAENLYSVASDEDEQVRGKLNVGCFVTLAPMILPELAHSFTQTYPGIHVHQVELHQEKLIQGLQSAELDVVITYDLQIPGEIKFVPLAKLPVHAVVSESHRLASRSKVSLAELIDDPFFLLDLPLSREYFLALFMRDGLEPKIGGRSAFQDVIRTMVANGYGYTLANVRPRTNMALDGRKVVRIELDGGHRPMVVGVASLAELSKSRIVEAFRAHCKERVSEEHIPGMEAPIQQRKIKSV